MERCENCDLPQATQEDFDTIPGGEGGHLCWAEFGTACEPAPWRERALKAEDRVRGLVQNLADVRAHLERKDQLLASRSVAFLRLSTELGQPQSDAESSITKAYLAGLAAGLAQGEEPDDA